MITTDSPTSPPLTDLAFITASAVVAIAVLIIIVICTLMLARSIIRDASRRKSEHEQARAEATARILQQQRYPQTRRGITEPPVPANFNWHHSIRVDGSLPPSYTEAEKLPPLEVVSIHRRQEASKIPLISDDNDDKYMQRSHEMSTRSASRHPQTTVYGATDITNTL